MQLMLIDDAVTCEQAAHIHRNALTGIVGGFIVASVLVAAFWSVSEHAPMAWWLGAGTLLACWRLWVWHVYGGREFSLPVARRWLRWGVIGAGLSGCIWAAGSLVFFVTDDFVYHTIFIFGVAMMGTTAMLSFSSHAPTFLAFFLPAAVPAAVAMMTRGTQLHVYVGSGIVIFVIVCLRFYLSFHRMFIKSVRLGFENVELVGQLTVQKEAAESANLAKSRFLAAASHDLRQPMHALTLYLAALESHDFQGTARANLANVRQCAQTMDEMFRALLDISRLDAGAVQMDIRNFALNPLLERIRIEFKPQADARGLSFKVLPCERIVRSDPDAVERILRNFIANAIRYTDHGRVLVGCRLQGEHLRIAVYDTGAGIAPAEQGKIFEEFYQVGNPERDRSKGIGLGLAIVDRLARLLAAPVSMDSKPGRGSSFAVDLPLADGAPEPAAAAASAVAGVDMGGLFIVVVDDEEAILAATRAVLEQWQCQVVTAASGAAALAALAECTRAPDALICDYRLRNHETGIDVIEALRSEFNADIPAILVSGDSAPARMQEAQANGLRVLHKPFNEHSLRSALAQILAQSETQSAA